MSTVAVSLNGDRSHETARALRCADRRRRPLGHRRRAATCRPSAPARRFAILEARDAIGGTWDLFRYPGHPLRLRHVHARLLASGRGRRRRRSPTAPRSCSYIRETAATTASSGTIRFHHRVVRRRVVLRRRALDGRGRAHRHRRDGRSSPAASSSRAPATTATTRATRRDFEGIERFAGEIVHPQHWPEDLDYAGKRVVVIGSGATAVTLVPAMAERGRARDDAPALAELRRLAARRGPARRRCCAARCRRRLAYPIVRWKNVLLTTAFFQLSRRAPKLVKALIRRGVERRLPPGYDVDTHFKPALQPVGPARLPGARRRPVRGDRERRARRSSTDRIETFTENGLELASGDGAARPTSIVTATGLNLLLLGGMAIAVDGRDDRPLGDRRLQGHDVQRRAEPGARARLHERLVDAQVRPGRASTSAGCSTTWTRTATASARRARPTRRSPTRAVHRPQVRLRAALDRRVPEAGRAARRGGCTRTTRATSCMLRRGALEDEGIEFSRASAAEPAMPVVARRPPADAFLLSLPRDKRFPICRFVTTSTNTPAVCGYANKYPRQGREVKRGSF